MRDDDFERTLQAGSRAVAETVRPRPAEAVRARGNQRRRRTAAGSALLAVAVLAGGAAAYAGVAAARPPAPASPPVSPGPSGTLPGPSVRPSSPPASSPPASSPPPSSSAPAGPTSGPATSPPTTTGTPAVARFLPGGPYSDDANDRPHYTVTLAYSGLASFQGGITFVFQDGRTQSGGTYTATLLGGGRLSFVLSSGQTLSGSYRSGGFSLDGCGAALKWATQPALCQFSYQPGATS